MYFPYPEKSGPRLQGVGAYHAARTSQGVPMSDLGAYHAARTTSPVQAAGLGQAPSVVSPWYPQMTPWPYIKGPIHTRPVFKEHQTGGNFVPYPIVRMPSLQGLGETSEQSAETRAKSVCEVVKPYPDAYPSCLNFSAKYIAADAVARAKLDADMFAASEACKNVKEFGPWSVCYYGKLEAWYEKPLYLGGAIIGGFAAAGLLLLALRRTSDE